MGEKKRRQFTAEFKAEAVRLATAGGRKLPDVAPDLGIRADLLRAWVTQMEGRAGLTAEGAFPGHGKRTPQDEEIRRLRREVEVLKQERDFLKKAAAYFAKSPK